MTPERYGSELNRDWAPGRHDQRAYHECMAVVFWDAVADMVRSEDRLGDGNRRHSEFVIDGWGL